MYTLNDAVKDFYDEVVKYLKNHYFYDDDVFQETVLKCFVAFQNKDVHKENVKRYFLYSYKTNMYTINKSDGNISIDEELNDVIENSLYEENDYGAHLDYLKLKEYFYSKYGKEKTELLKLYNLGGYSIRELEEKSGIKNLHYIFRKMTNDAKNAFA